MSDEALLDYLRESMKTLDAPPQDLDVYHLPSDQVIVYLLLKILDRLDAAEDEDEEEQAEPEPVFFGRGEQGE